MQQDGKINQSKIVRNNTGEYEEKVAQSEISGCCLPVFLNDILFHISEEIIVEVIALQATYYIENVVWDKQGDFLHQKISSTKTFFYGGLFAWCLLGSPSFTLLIHTPHSHPSFTPLIRWDSARLETLGSRSAT